MFSVWKNNKSTKSFLICIHTSFIMLTGLFKGKNKNPSKLPSKKQINALKKNYFCYTFTDPYIYIYLYIKNTKNIDQYYIKAQYGPK